MNKNATRNATNMNSTSQALNNFITKLAKDRDIKITGKLLEKCSVSQATFYRALNNGKIDPRLEKSIIDALHMGQEEQETFRNLIDQTADNGGRSQSNHVMDSFIFGSKDKPEMTKNLSLSYYDDKLIKISATEFTSIILKHAACDMYQCKILCINKEVQDETFNILSQLLEASSNVTIEHLISFPTKDKLVCAQILKDIAPLLNYSNYQVLYNEAGNSGASFDCMTESMLVETSWQDCGKEKRQFFILSCVNGHGHCTVFEDNNMFFMLSNIYQQYRANFKPPITSNLDSWASSFDTFNKFLALEAAHEEALVKPNFCYDKIPINVYESWAARFSSELKAHWRVDTEEGYAQMKYHLSERHRSAFKDGDIDIYSKAGLESFTKSGYISDHFEGLPNFNEDERKQILLTLKNGISRTTYKDSKYKAYITHDSINYVLVSFKGKGITLEFTNHINSRDKLYTITFEIPELANMIYDYANEHISAFRAMQPGAAIAFVERLIASLE